MHCDVPRVLRHFTWFLAGFEGKSQKAASNFLIGRHFYREVTLREKERDAEKSARSRCYHRIFKRRRKKKEGRRRGFEEERETTTRTFTYTEREKERKRESFNIKNALYSNQIKLNVTTAP